jgi:hypothetical protein
MSDLYLQRSYFDRAHDNPATFLLSHSFGVFQYFFGQLAVGVVMGVVFLIGVAILLRGKSFSADRASSRRLGIFLVVPFVVAGSISLAHLYPYGGVRHLAFLIIPAVAGVSVAIAWLASNRWDRAFSVTAVVILACIVFGKPRQPRMERADQSRKHMADAVNFIAGNIKPSDLIFTDYQSDLILGHYLCQQRPVPWEVTPANFEQFSCAGRQIVASDFRAAWMFGADNFPREWQRAVQSYNLKPGETVWIVQTGWGIDLPEDLQRRYAEFRGLNFESFGKNIQIFKMTVGQPMPAAAQ